MKRFKLLPILLSLFALGWSKASQAQCSANFTAVQNGASIDITNNSVASTGSMIWDVYNITTGNTVYNGTNSSTSFSVPIWQTGNYVIEVWLTCGDSLHQNLTVDCSSNPILLSPTVTNATCPGSCDGEIALSPSGGFGSGYYMDSWSNVPTGTGGPFVNNDLCAGTYSVTVSDSFGCVAIDSFVISQPNQLLVGPGLDSIFAVCANDVINIAPSVSGGTPPYSYSWSTGAASTSIQVTSAGFYNLTVTDANGCQGILYNIVEYPTAMGSIVSSMAETASGSCDGSASVIASGGVAPYTYAWSNGAITSSISNLCAGTYSVTITDANGCTTIDSTIVSPGNCYLISGTIAPATDARVYLIQENGGYLYAVDSVDITSGSYSFAGVCAGTYHVKAALLPASSQFGSWLPTYYQNAALWSNSTALVISSSVTGIDVTLQQGSNPGGAGFISGFISNGANRGGNPAPGLTVYLTNEDNEIAAFTETNADGEYEFSGIALGAYNVWVDALNNVAVPYPVALTSENPISENRDFEIASGTVRPIEALGIAGANSTLRIFPNPVADVLHIRFDQPVSEVQITNMTGSIARATVTRSTLGADVSVENLATGVYILHISMDDGTTEQHRFIKK